MNNEVEEILNEADNKKQQKAKRAKSKNTKKPKKLSKKAQQIQDRASNTVLPDKYSTVWTEEDLTEMCSWLSKQEIIAVDTETLGLNPHRDTIVGFSVYAPDRGYYVPLKHIDDIGDIIYMEGDKVVGVDYVKCLPKYLVTNMIKPIFEDRSKKFIFHNCSFDMHILRIWMGIDIVPYFDTVLSQSLLDENQSKKLKDLAPIYLKTPADTFSSLFGKITFDKVPILINPDTRLGNLASYYAIKDTELTYKLFEFHLKYLEKDELKDIHSLMFDIEMPFALIAYQAEVKGIKIDEEYLTEVVAKKLHEEVDALKKEITSHIGDINLNSPAQVSYVLYKVLELPRVNKDSPNSTDKKTLSKLKKHHPVIPMIIDYKAKVKLVTAFADKLPQSAVDGRIYTNFRTIGAKTGRMSSANPNMQQVPSRIGNLIRNAFMADEGRLLVSVDFSQQELRVLAHVSKDETLMDIYKNDKDVHSMTAVGMWNKKNTSEKTTYQDFEYRRGMVGYFQDKNGDVLDDKFNNEEYLDKLMNSGNILTTDPTTLRKDVELGIKYDKLRKKAKTVNFGIIYGMSAKGLADTLEISEEEAQTYIEGYFDAYPGVKKWMSKQKDFILKNKHVKTLLGRKRRLYREIDSGVFWMIQSGIRKGVNAIIQGS